MKTILLQITIVMLFFTCGSPSQNEHQILADEIAKLTTDSLQTEYLEAIHHIDQQVRIDEDSVLQQYGHDSKEHQAQWRLIAETDELNLQKIEMYLAIHGHPKKERHSSLALGAPWIVLHHQPSNGSRRHNFHYLYKAYQEGDLDGGSLAFLLNRLYRNEFGHRLQLTSPFKEAFEIDTLMRVLDLGITTTKE